jgi:hypothetical protein
VDFALSKQPSYVQAVLSQSLSSVLPNDKQSTALLFTNKEETSPMLKAISTEFKQRLVVGEVKESDKKLCEKYVQLIFFFWGGGFNFAELAQTRHTLPSLFPH